MQQVFNFMTPNYITMFLSTRTMVYIPQLGRFLEKLWKRRCFIIMSVNFYTNFYVDISGTYFSNENRMVIDIDISFGISISISIGNTVCTQEKGTVQYSSIFLKT